VSVGQEVDLIDDRVGRRDQLVVGRKVQNRGVVADADGDLR